MLGYLLAYFSSKLTGENKYNMSILEYLYVKGEARINAGIMIPIYTQKSGSFNKMSVPNPKTNMMPTVIA
jgi:hypothetical protein